MKRNLDSTLTERLEMFQYKLTRNIHAPSRAMQKMLAAKTSVGDARLIRTPFYVETREWERMSNAIGRVMKLA